MANGRSTTGIAWRAAGSLATLAAAGLLALVIAHWTWMLVAPAPVHIAPAPPDDPAGTLVAAQLFGARGSDAGPASDTFADVRLLGVIAARDGGGYALFRLPAGPRLVARGDEVTPGLRLASIGNDGVTLHDSSGDRSLALRGTGARNGAAPPSTGAAPAPAAPRVRAAESRGPNVAAVDASKCQPPSGFKGEVVRLNVELVGGLIAQPDAWRAMVEPANGALVVKETAGFGQMVGLQQGDRVEQANGIALTVPDDVVGAVLRPLAANQPVRLVGKRNGQPRELWIANVSCGTG
jgi:hypothetical protein